MIFLTVGTYPLPFDRLLRIVDEAINTGVISDTVVAQIGCSQYSPMRYEYSGTLNKEDFDDLFSRSSGVISHAGMGTISMALERTKPLLVIPRLRKYGEHVNDHQLHGARKFEELGHILVAYNEFDFAAKYNMLSRFRPKPRTARPDLVADRIGQFLHHAW